MTRIELRGCAPEPLSAYLKALGLFRIVGEQLDPDIRGYWEDGSFVLASSLVSAGELEEFLLHDYRPTPITNPWNGGSGYFLKDKEPRKLVAELANSSSPRLAEFREVIGEIHRILQDLGLTEKPDKIQKKSLLTLCRNRLSDQAVRWIDAAVVMTPTDLRWPPLLGVGGNDGRLEFSANYIRHILAIMGGDGRPATSSAGWLVSALYGHVAPGLAKSAAGQFNPGLAGGPNASAGFDGEARVNPWEFVLAMEGALLFAAASTHRLGHHDGDALSYPFTVKVAGAGQPSLAIEDEVASRAEMWLPLWSRAAGYPEIRRLFEEGRAEVFGRQAHDAIDFAIACSSLGVDRGIDEFHRYAFLQRAGMNYFAVPLARVSVKRHARADVVRDVMDKGWLQRAQRYARKKEAPADFKRGVRGVEEAIFALCRQGRPENVNDLLKVLGDFERLVSVSRKSRDIMPPLWLGSSWIDEADHDSWSFRLALGMASLIESRRPGIRPYLSPIDEEKPQQWAPGSTPDVVWARGGDLSTNMLALLDRRLLNGRAAVNSERLWDRGEGAQDKKDKPFSALYPVALSDVLEFLVDEHDDQEIDRLVQGISLVIFPATRPGVARVPDQTKRLLVPGSYAAMKLIFIPNQQLGRTLGNPEINVPVPGELVGLLRAGRVEQALRLSMERLRHSGVPIPFKTIQAPAVSPGRLAASMLLPLAPRDIPTLCDVLGLNSFNQQEKRG